MAISGNIPICKTSSHSIAAAAIGMFHEAAGAALNTASTLHRCCVRWVLIIMSPVRAGGGERTSCATYRPKCSKKEQSAIL